MVLLIILNILLDLKNHYIKYNNIITLKNPFKINKQKNLIKIVYYSNLQTCDINVRERNFEKGRGASNFGNFAIFIWIFLIEFHSFFINCIFDAVF